MSTDLEQIRGTGKPLHAALKGVGFTDLESLHGADYTELSALHGVGKRGLERLQEALVERGLSLAGKVPEPTPRGATITAGHTGVSATDIKTKPTGVDPAGFIDSLGTPRRVDHGKLLLELFNRVTGAEAVMWGPTMIGYGEVHYASHTGREGDWFRLGFSPRKAKISLYGLKDYPGAAEDLERLGKHTVGAGCLYINKPDDIDLDVLEKMIRISWSAEYPDVQQSH